MTRSLPLAVAAASLLAAGAASAQTPPTSTSPAMSLGALYVAGTIGTARHDIDGGSIDRQLGDLGFAGASTSVDDDDTAWRITGGWQVLPWLGVEVSYFDLGNPGFSATALRPGTFEASLDVTGWQVDVVPQYVFQDTGFAVFGRLGYVRSETEARFGGSGAFSLRTDSVESSNNSWDAGLGVSYAFTNNFSVRAEWTRYMDLGDDSVGGEFDADMFAVSAVWRFR